MNKLMGFYELKNSSLPTIPWEIYTPGIELDDNLLWTIRSAVNLGDDLNLPRLIGKSSAEAKEFADKLYEKMGKNGIVIYYPYFVAHKSGTLDVFYDKVIIEAVKDDLWNLVTYNKLDSSLSYNSNFDLTSWAVDNNFLTENEVGKLLGCVRKVKQMFKDDLIEGKSVLLEWSFASKCGKDNSIQEEIYLVFYEARTVN